jgi:hypothetical protein
VGYGPGRHHLEDTSTREVLSTHRFEQYAIKFEVAVEGFIAKYKWAPWPQSIQRMLNINAKYAQQDKEIQYNPSGELIFSHQYNTSIQLNNERNRILESHYILSLKDLVIINNQNHIIENIKNPNINYNGYNDEDIDYKYDAINSIHKQYLDITGEQPYICSNYSCFYRYTRSNITDYFHQPIKILHSTGNYNIFIRVNFIYLLENKYKISQMNSQLNDGEYIINENLLKNFKEFCKDIYKDVDIDDEDFQNCLVILNTYINSFIFESKEF